MRDTASCSIFDKDGVSILLSWVESRYDRCRDVIGLWVTCRLAEALGGAPFLPAGGTGDSAMIVVTLPLNPAGTATPGTGWPAALQQRQ
jgi:hypothetical protein